jgi:hypothetical protein
VQKKAQTIFHTLQDHELDFAIMVNNKRITGSITKEIKNILSRNRPLNFYKTKWATEYQNIMREHFNAVIKRRKSGRIIIEMIHNLTPTQQFIQKPGLSLDSRCFFCNEDDETIPHILTCSYRKRTKS